MSGESGRRKCWKTERDSKSWSILPRKRSCSRCVICCCCFWKYCDCGTSRICDNMRFHTEVARTSRLIRSITVMISASPDVAPSGTISTRTRGCCFLVLVSTARLLTACSSESLPRHKMAPFALPPAVAADDVCCGAVPAEISCLSRGWLGGLPPLCTCASTPQQWRTISKSPRSSQLLCS